jgi:hypothetical protein
MKQWIPFLSGVTLLALLRSLLMVAVVAMATLPMYLGRTPGDWFQFTLGVPLSIAFGISSFLSLWLMLCRTHLGYCLLAVAIFDLSATSITVTTAKDMLPETDYSQADIATASTMLIYRTGVLAAVLGVGLLLKSVTRIRLSVPAIENAQSTDHRRHSLLGLLGGASLCAVSLASFRELVAQVGDRDLRGLFLVFAVAELFPLVFVILPPIFLAARTGRKRVKRMIHIAWPIGVITTVAVGAYFLNTDSTSRLADSLHMFAVLSLHRLTLAVAFWWAGRQGVELISTKHTSQLADHQPSVQKPLTKQRLVLSTSALIAFALLHVMVSRYYLPAIIFPLSSHPWRTARGVRLLQHEMGYRPRTYPETANNRAHAWPRLEVGWQSRDTDESAFIYEGYVSIQQKHDIDHRVLNCLLPKGERVERLSLEPFRTDLCSWIDGVVGLEQLSLGGGVVAAKDLQWLARNTKLRKLFLTLPALEADQASALQAFSGQDVEINLSIASPISQSARHNLRKSKIVSIDCPVDSHDASALADIGHCQLITIRDSRITGDQCDQLAKVTEDYHISFFDCTMGKDCIAPLSQLQGSSCTFEVYWEDVTEADLLRLADNPHKCEYSFARTETAFTPVFEAKFNHRAGPDICSVRLSYLHPVREDSYGVTFYSAPFSAYGDDSQDWLLLLSKSASIETAAAEMAHSVARDAGGQITELNLVDMVIFEDGAYRLSELSQLTTLRIGHKDQNDRLFANVRLLGSIRKLEIPGYAFSDVAMHQIALHTELRYLQLPLPHYSYYFGTYHTASMNFIERDASEHRTDDIARLLAKSLKTHCMASGLYSDDMTWTSDSVNYLRWLKQLEFLYLPGWIIDEGNLDTIVGLSKLQTLRAPFSELPAESIRKLATMPSLRNVTIGINPQDDDARTALGELTALDELHLLIIDPQLHADHLKQTEFEQPIRTSLPNHQLKFQYLPWSISSSP